MHNAWTSEKEKRFGCLLYGKMVKYKARKPVNTQESGRGVMFGGRLMDTFIDKLAHKLTAQEMIKANSAADAAELQRAKTQIAKYEELLRELREVGRLNAESAKQVRELAAEGAARLDETQKVSVLIDETIVKLQEFQNTQMDMESLEAKLVEVKESIQPMLDQLSEHVHKENVKVYRNVQAVVVDETAKVAESVEKSIKRVSAKVSAVLTLSIVALLASVAGLVFQILVYLNIL